MVDDTEEWAHVDGYVGRYMVSNLGRVYSYKRGRIMKAQLNRYGYEVVCLRKQEPRGKLVSIHKLVALAFVGAGGGQIRHLDGNKRNNRFTNLAWGSAKDNALDRDRHGTTARGERQWKAKLTPEMVAQIRALHCAGMGVSEIGRAVGMNKSRVHEITSRKTWKHVP